MRLLWFYVVCLSLYFPFNRQSYNFLSNFATSPLSNFPINIRQIYNIG